MFNELSPFEFFRHETNHADAVVRTEAMKKVALVCAMMGPDKTRNDMLPYLQTKVEDMDQVLIALSEKLEKFTPLMGGPDHLHILIPMLEALCTVEEVTVRNVAAQSTAKLLKNLSPQHKNQIAAFIEFYKRISNEESGELFYSRYSASIFIAELYSLLTSDSDKSTLREIYVRLCKDELPIVRRTAVLQFMKLCHLVDNEALTNDMVNLMKAVLADESPLIQVPAVEFLPLFCIFLKKAGATGILTADLLPYIKSLSDDPSWRLRQAMCKSFGEFAHAFTPTEVADEIFPALIHLMLDPESEVRAIAVRQLYPYLDVLGTSQFVSQLTPVAVQLVDDPNNTVRKILAEVCVEVAVKVGPEMASQYMSDLILKLMEDEDPLVRLRIIKKMNIIAEEAPSLCTRLTECLKPMFNNSNWRVRKGLVEAMPAVTKHMGQDFFVEHFMALSLLLLKDGVEEVRAAAAVSLAHLPNVTDPHWVHEKIFPSYKNIVSEEYLHRLSLLLGLQEFLRLESVTDRFQQDVVTLLLNVTKDKVPNARLRAAQILHGAQFLAHASSMKDQIQEGLTLLQTDKDKDVRYFATHRYIKPEPYNYIAEKSS